MTGSTVPVTAAEEARPLRRDAQRNRERIIAAAHEVFATRGFAATLDDVAHHAGVGVGTVYRRFPTKEDLVAAAFADRMQDVVALAERALAADSAWDGLVLLLTESVRMQARDRGLRDMLLTVDKRTLPALKGRVPELATAVIERARAEGTLRPDFEPTDLPIIFAMLSEVARTCADSRPDAYERYLALIIDGLRAGAARGDLGAPLTVTCVQDALTKCVPPLEPRRR
ncbi:TetR/AcrR family transcriptional regulator [Actinoplanes sp. RD1]|uniref:TetR/AcrR family transcriptional regulator n=1 Tax=Actinoplanes sp. RD1 TaxID=3064538 RepID=UPI0027413D21|nr:TetR/AcrR family transcriptional regulator [Actinoplanes sp. RD1]